MVTKTKSLALISGLLGLIGGTVLLLSHLFFGHFSALLGDFGVTLLRVVIKLAALGLGIASLAYYKGSRLFNITAGVLLIIGANSIAPLRFLDWINGVILIVGGIFFLAGFKNKKI